jgi:hypothetical protein
MRVLRAAVLVAAFTAACNSTVDAPAERASKQTSPPVARAQAASVPRQLAEFGVIPLCSLLKALPEDAAPLGEACDPKDNMTGCQFTTARDAGAIRYQVLGGVVRMKRASLSSASGPYGLTATDDARQASAKVARVTGLRLRRIEDDGGAFLQSAELPCSGNTYRLVIELDANGKATDVLLTSLPMV